MCINVHLHTHCTYVWKTCPPFFIHSLFQGFVHVLFCCENFSVFHHICKAFGGKFTFMIVCFAIFIQVFLKISSEVLEILFSYRKADIFQFSSRLIFFSISSYSSIHSPYTACTHKQYCPCMYAENFPPLFLHTRKNWKNDTFLAQIVSHVIQIHT